MYERKHTTMFTRIGQFTVRRRRLVLMLTVVVVIVAGMLGGAVFDRLSSGGFADPDSESTRADDLLEGRFGAGAPNVVLLVTASDGDVDAPEVAAVGQQLTDELAAYPQADDVVSYWSLGSPPPLASTRPCWPCTRATPGRLTPTRPFNGRWPRRPKRPPAGICPPRAPRASGTWPPRPPTARPASA